MKKGIIAILVAVIAAVGLTTLALWLIGGEPLSKVISYKGYKITVPQEWTAGADGTLTDSAGAMVGKYVLIYEEPNLSDTASYAGVSVKGEVASEAFSDTTIKNTFEADGGAAVQYFIKDLPNPAPYAASVTLYKTSVGEKECDRIAKSFALPELGANPPAKNIAAPIYTEVGTDKACKLVCADQSVAVKNISLIDMFIKRQTAKESTGLDILCYEENSSGIALKTWCHIESDGGRGYMYAYYDRGDGVYTYDNNPLVFEGITKESSEETGTTFYSLKVGEAETMRFLEIPMNLYRDNAEALLSLKTEESSDESIMKILEQIMSDERLAGVTAEKKDGNVILKFSENQKTDLKTLTKDAAIIFSLSSDVESVTAENADGTKYVVSNEDIFSEVETPVEKVTESPEEFAKFTEDVEKIEPEVPEKTGENVADGTVIYSTSVVFSENTMVTHPRTGKQVQAGPYARKKGYGQYVGKTITCTVKKSGRGYLATATCGGSVIASYPLESWDAAQNFINTVKAYL